MSTGLPSDEVAEDYAYTLKDLTSNDRYAISNLTVIAKENTEHALAISKVLESHIRSVSLSVRIIRDGNRIKELCIVVVVETVDCMLTYH